ncbi:MAG: hypothetical protein M3Z33_03880 [Actinomycetota bacterium]|nr:hypothetical protein [Actinomycetota bacterium]
MRDVDAPPRVETAPPVEPSARVEIAPAATRPWWYARAMYGLVVMVGLGAVLVWVSTGGALAIAATVMAVMTAIPALSLARTAPRERRKRD